MAEEKATKPKLPSGMGADCDLPEVIAYFESDHHDKPHYSIGDLQSIRGAVQGFMARILDGENSDITQVFTHALIGSLLRTATQNVTDKQAKRKADAMLRATGLAGRLPEKSLNGRLSGAMLEYMHELMVGEAFGDFGVTQARVIREIADSDGDDSDNLIEDLRQELRRKNEKKRGKEE